jgi:hypothetical protein
MTVAELAISLNQVLPKQPSLGWIRASSLQDSARFAGQLLRSLAARTQDALNPATQAFGEDYPMVTALYESHQAQCLQRQAFAELRGDAS